MKTSKIVKIASLFVVILWITNWVLVKFFFANDDQGRFGDMFGATTSLFSGFTIIGLIYTIILQRKDIRIARAALKEQKKDLKLNRDELELTRKEFQQQNTTLKRQRFEGTFFHLIDLYNRSVDRLNLGNQKISGRHYLIDYYQSIQTTLLSIGKKVQAATSPVYLENYVTFKPVLDPYFSDVVMILAFIINSKEIPSDEMSNYVRIFQAQLSYQDKVILYYHAHLSNDEELLSYYRKSASIMYLDKDQLFLDIHIDFSSWN